MKRIIFLLLALTVLSFAAFAQDKGPEVTYGFSGSFEMDVFSSNKSDTYESGDFNVPIAKSNPLGLKATNYVLSPNVALDWDKMSIAADATYDGFRADDDDWSSFNLTTTWKDFYGFELKSEVSGDNEDTGGTTPDAVNISPLDHDFTITLDRLEDQGIKLWTKYDANALFVNFDASGIGTFVTDLVDSFTEIGFEVDTEGLGAKLVYAPGHNTANPGEADFTTAWIEARDMFGMWTMLVNDGDAMELRLADLDTDVTIDREQFGIGEDNDILELVEGTDLNVKHTLSLTDAMTLTIGTIVPYDDITWVDWIRDENLVANLEMGLEGIGTIGVGGMLAKDYVAMAPGAVVFVEGPTSLIGAYATDTAVTDSGSAIWVDANLSELVDGIDLFASMDVQFNQYVDIADAIEEAPYAADDPYVISPVGYQVIHVGAEAGMSVTEDLKVMAAFMAGLGMGLDHEKLYGLAYEEGESTNYVDNDAVAGEWSEKDQLATVYGVNSLILDIRAEFALNDTVGLWAQDTLTMNEGYLNDSTAGYYVAANDFGTAGLAGYGYFNKNTLEVGADLTASENADITLSAAYDMFLGLPSSSDFYPDGAADAEKEAIDYDYDLWKDNNFAPLSVSVAFSFSY